jgi:predicted ABC-type ATPase
VPRKPKGDETVASRLEMTVEFEDVLSDSDVMEIVEKARETGHVIKATYEVLKTTKRELV